MKNVILPKRHFWSNVSKYLQPNLSQTESVALWSESGSKVPESGWKRYDDSSIGGKSQCSFSVSNQTVSGKEMKVIQFSGKILFSKELSRAAKIKGGFCAIRCDVEPIDLRDHEGLKLYLKSSFQDVQYAFNIGSESFFEGDLYQWRFKLPKDQWCECHIPFKNFTLTANGAEREEQRIGDNMWLRSIGFLVSGKSDEDFDLQVGHVVALPELDYRQVQMTESKFAIRVAPALMEPVLGESVADSSEGAPPARITKA